MASSSGTDPEFLVKEGRASTFDFVKCFEKLHKIEILVREGGGARSAPNRSATDPLYLFTHFFSVKTPKKVAQICLKIRN